MASDPIKVSVTQQDIITGVRDSYYCCPIALALSRTTGLRWVVGECWARPEGCPRGIRPRLPESARSFIRWFDDGLPVQPFEFEVEL